MRSVPMRSAVLLSALLLTSGCATSFTEDHYFKSVSASSGRPTNYFRLRIHGRACFSSARYIAGYYDERAVDLFFDEMKSASSQDDAKIESLFQGGEIDLVGEKIAPLPPAPEHGAFLMIFNTNAKAVANAIGAFTLFVPGLLLPAESTTPPPHDRARCVGPPGNRNVVPTE